MTDLSGKTALVTGASRGIGRATALELAKAGAQVLVHYSAGAKEAAAVVAEIAAGGGRAQALQADLASPDGAHDSGEADPRHRRRTAGHPRRHQPLRYAGNPTEHTALVKAAVSEGTTPTAAHCLPMLKVGCNSINRAAADFASAVCPSPTSAATRQM